MNETKTVAIIGAGPVGLAAAAHVLERCMTPIVLEAGREPAHAVRQWQHVQLFSPWEYNVDKAAERLLSSITPRSQLVRSGRGEADPVAESVAAAASSRCTAQAAPSRSSSLAPALRI